MMLAIDPGLAVTGWCCLSGGKLMFRDDNLPLAGTLRTSPKFGTTEERIGSLRKALAFMFDEFGPEHVAIEGYVYQGARSETGNSLIISRLVGIAEGLATARHASTVVIDKNTVNRRIGLTGEVPKRRVRQMVEAMLRLEPGLLRNEHEVDAAALGWVASMQIRRAA